MIDTTFGWVRLSKLQVPDARIGILDHEKQRTQPIEIDVGLWVPVSVAAQSEDIAQATDYAVVAESIRRLALSRHFLLVETLCEELAAMLFAEFPHVERATVEVHKPQAVKFARVSIAIERARRK